MHLVVPLIFIISKTNVSVITISYSTSFATSFHQHCLTNFNKRLTTILVEDNLWAVWEHAWLFRCTCYSYRRRYWEYFIVAVGHLLIDWLIVVFVFVVVVRCHRPHHHYHHSSSSTRLIFFKLIYRRNIYLFMLFACHQDVLQDGLKNMERSQVLISESLASYQTMLADLQVSQINLLVHLQSQVCERRTQSSWHCT